MFHLCPCHHQVGDEASSFSAPAPLFTPTRSLNIDPQSCWPTQLLLHCTYHLLPEERSGVSGDAQFPFIPQTGREWVRSRCLDTFKRLNQILTFAHTRNNHSICLIFNLITSKLRYMWLYEKKRNLKCVFNLRTSGFWIFRTAHPWKIYSARCISIIFQIHHRTRYLKFGTR